MRQVLLVAAWAAVAAFVLAPPLPWAGSVGIQYGDFLWFGMVIVALMAVGVHGALPRPPSGGASRWFLVYVGMILLFPIIGIILLGAPLAWYLGDLRWVQVLSILFVMWIVYNGRSPAQLGRHIVIGIWVLVLFQYPFVLSQVGMRVLSWSPTFLLELWYPGGESGYGPYGHHVGRFAGAMDQASALALVGGLGFVVGALRMSLRPNIETSLLTLLSLGLMVAAGNRAMLFAAPPVVISMLVLMGWYSGRIRKAYVAWGATGFLLLIPLLALLYRFDVGRIATSDRYRTLFTLVMGRESFEGLTGRGGVRWWLPLVEAYRDWTPIGTLVNSPHALSHLRTIDGYFVVASAQAGPFILLPFLILLGVLLWRGGLLLCHQIEIGAVVFAIPAVLFISSITQNTMTALFPRLMLMIGTLLCAHQILVSSMKRRQSPGAVPRTSLDRWLADPRAARAVEEGGGGARASQERCNWSTSLVMW